MSTNHENGELEALTCRMAAGEESAFAEFGRLFGPKLWAYFRRLGLSPTDAEDLAVTVVTEISLRILQYTPRSDGRFSGWVFTIAYRLMIDWKRQNRRHQGQSGRAELLANVAADSMLDQDHATSGREQASIVGGVHGAMEQLSELDRNIVQLRNLGIEHSYEEIGRRLGISAGNARVRHHRALRKLETILSHLSTFDQASGEGTAEAYVKEVPHVH